MEKKIRLTTGYYGDNMEREAINSIVHSTLIK